MLPTNKKEKAIRKSRLGLDQTNALQHCIAAHPPGNHIKLYVESKCPAPPSQRKESNRSCYIIIETHPERLNRRPFIIEPIRFLSLLYT